MSKCSLAHQLLPKDQQTKPDEVNHVYALTVRIGGLLFIGLRISIAYYQRNRVGIEGT